MLQYHEWVVDKAHEGPRTRDKLQRVIEADLQMRTMWGLAYSRGEFPTLTAAISHHRSESAYLFSDINKSKRDYDEGDVGGSKGGGKGGRKGNGRDRSRTPPRQGDDRRLGGAAPRNEPPFILQTQYKGREICAQYNKAKGCGNKSCQKVHTCNYPGCTKTHPRYMHHPTQPPTREF